MNPTLIASLRTLLADPDRPDRDALFAVLPHRYPSQVLACLASTGTLVQVAADLRIGWLWCLSGWERHIDDMLAILIDSRQTVAGKIIEAWSKVPSAVGVLRDRTDDLIAWAMHALASEWYDDLAILLGPSNATARFLAHGPWWNQNGKTLRRWSMATDWNDPTAWQTMIDTNLYAALRPVEGRESSFPAWGWDDSVGPTSILFSLVADLSDGWSPAHPSIRGRIAALERLVRPDLPVESLAFVSGISRSQPIADGLNAAIMHDPQIIPIIAKTVPWTRLHPDSQAAIDAALHRLSSPWETMGQSAIGHKPVTVDPTIETNLILWRFEPAVWETLDPDMRDALLSSVDIPHHCFGWGLHPDLVMRRDCPDGAVFSFWNCTSMPDDLQAWWYADLLRSEKKAHEARTLLSLLDVLPPNRRARFEQIIDWRLVGRSAPPWDWNAWAALPATDRRSRLRDRLRFLGGVRWTYPAWFFWRARHSIVDSVVIAFRSLLGGNHAPTVLAPLLAQIPILRDRRTDPVPPPPVPDDLPSEHRAQVERLPLTPNDQAYAAWCLWVLSRRADVGADLIALHPDVAVALAPFLPPNQQKAVAASPATQGWDSITNLRWAAACASAKEPPTLPIQRSVP